MCIHSSISGVINKIIALKCVFVLSDFFMIDGFANVSEIIEFLEDNRNAHENQNNCRLNFLAMN